MISIFAGCLANHDRAHSQWKHIPVHFYRDGNYLLSFDSFEDEEDMWYVIPCILSADTTEFWMPERKEDDTKFERTLTDAIPTKRHPYSVSEIKIVQQRKQILKDLVRHH